MSLKEIIKETLRLKQWDGYVKKVAEAYGNAKQLNPEAIKHWDALNYSNHNFFNKILSRIDIHLVSDNNIDHNITLNGKTYKVNYLAGGQPYQSAEEMSSSVKLKKQLSVSIDHSEHPVFSVEDNIIFRTVHDYCTHILGDYSFGLKGELAAYNLHSKLASRLALPALFTEVVGQVCFYETYGHFPIQKVDILTGFNYQQIGEFNGDLVKSNFSK